MQLFLVAIRRNPIRIVAERMVDRPYSRVPAIGEMVMLGDDDESGGAAVVDGVWWGDGPVTVLIFYLSPDEDDETALKRLAADGFEPPIAGSEHVDLRRLLGDVDLSGLD